MDQIKIMSNTCNEELLSALRTESNSSRNPTGIAQALHFILWGEKYEQKSAQLQMQSKNGKIKKAEETEKVKNKKKCVDWPERFTKVF